MRLALIQPPSGLHDRAELAPPLGLLLLATHVRHHGFEVELVDMNLRGIRDHAWVETDFYDNAVRAVLETRPDVVGFTSMALESHVCLEIARRIAEVRPEIVVVLGGPHFGSIATEVLELYPWVDFVVVGEGETALLELLRHLRSGAPSSSLAADPPANVALRAAAGSVVLDRVLKPHDSLDALPSPDYASVDLEAYFAANPRRLLDYEHGRGCIFRCSFCYSPNHWGQGSQVKQVERIVEEVKHLHSLGARHLFFVQDNFPNSMPLALEICRALAAAELDLTWNCYATLPHLEPEFLDALAAAGCTSVFIGVDAVTTDSKASFAKKFFKGWKELEEKLRACLERGIVPTCAFMIDPPAEDPERTDMALLTALSARILGCGIRLNTLTIYNGTATAEAMKDREIRYCDLKPRLLLDTPSVIWDNPYAREHPSLFPFHSTPMDPEDYGRFVAGMHIAFTLFKSFPRTLLQYVLSEGGSLWQLLDELAEGLGDLAAIPARLRRPMERELFVREFPKRVRSAAAESAFRLELMELDLGSDAQVPEVELSVDGRLVTCQPRRFGLVELPHPPALYGSLDGLGPSPDADDAALEAARPYLLVRRKRRIDYFDIADEVFEALNRIERPQGHGQALDVSPALYGALVDADLVRPSTQE